MVKRLALVPLLFALFAPAVASGRNASCDRSRSGLHLVCDYEVAHGRTVRVGPTCRPFQFLAYPTNDARPEIAQGHKRGNRVVMRDDRLYVVAVLGTRSFTIQNRSPWRVIVQWEVNC